MESNFLKMLLRFLKQTHIHTQLINSFHLCARCPVLTKFCKGIIISTWKRKLKLRKLTDNFPLPVNKGKNKTQTQVCLVLLCHAVCGKQNLKKLPLYNFFPFWCGWKPMNLMRYLWSDYIIEWVITGVIMAKGRLSGGCNVITWGLLKSSVFCSW